MNPYGSEGPSASSGDKQVAPQAKNRETRANSGRRLPRRRQWHNARPSYQKPIEGAFNRYGSEGPQLSEPQLIRLLISRAELLRVIRRIFGNLEWGAPDHDLVGLWADLANLHQLGNRSGFQPVERFVSRWADLRRRVRDHLEQSWLQEETEAVRLFEDVLVVILNHMHQSYRRYFTREYQHHRLWRSLPEGAAPIESLPDPPP